MEAVCAVLDGASLPFPFFVALLCHLCVCVWLFSSGFLYGSESWAPLPDGGGVQKELLQTYPSLIFTQCQADRSGGLSL